MVDPRKYFKKSQDPIYMAKKNLGIAVEPEDPHRTAVKQLRQKVNEINNVSPELMKEGSTFYNKEKFKGTLRRNGIRTPETYMFVDKHEDAVKAINVIKKRKLKEFVIKPNNQSQGKNIVVLKKRDKRGYEEPDGTLWYLIDIQDKIGSILDTSPPLDRGVILEERVHTHPDLNKWNPYPGTISDMRIYVVYHMLVFAKLRVPSNKSHGLANTGQGGCAFYVSKDGLMNDEPYMTNTVTAHPDTGMNAKGEQLPFWDEIALATIRVSKCFNLPFHSADLTITPNGEAIIIESEKIPYLSNFSTAGANYIMNLIKKYSGEKLE